MTVCSSRRRPEPPDCPCRGARDRRTPRRARTLAHGDAAHVHHLDQIMDRAGRYPLHTGLLNDFCERLLGDPPGVHEARNDVFQKAAQLHHVTGCPPVLGLRFRNQTLAEIPVTPESRWLATALPEGALRERLYLRNRHHASGHAPFPRRSLETFTP